MTVAGDKPGLAQVLKLTNNILSAVAMVATAEAYVMGAKGGVNPEVLTEAINKGSGRNSATLNKIPTSVLDRSFAYGAPIYILDKDLDLAIAQGEALGVPMWVCQAARLVFKHAVFEGMQDRDMTEIVKAGRARCRLPDAQDQIGGSDVAGLPGEFTCALPQPKTLVVSLY